MGNKSKKNKDSLVSFVNNYFAWEEKRREKKYLKKQKREEIFGKYRLIKNERTRAIVSLTAYIIFFIILYIVLK